MIRAENYSVKLGDFHMEKTDLSIDDGEIFALLGETGSGKSVLLESLAGLQTPKTGCIFYDDTPVWDIPLQKRQIGFVYQDYSLFHNMKIGDNIEFGLRMHKVPKKERRCISDEIMEKLHISHLRDRYPYTLSGGEQQRTALARALVLKPKILFMDEPFSALDPNTRVRMYGLIREIHRDYSCTIVFVTHNFMDARELADRVGVMLRGSLRLVCSSRRLFEEDADEEVRAFLGNGDVSL